jgi:tripartite-type tricarboxylate transporter receptor subunit TctC
MRLPAFAALAAGILSFVTVTEPARAAGDSFAGQTVSMYISTVPGGGYDLYGRLVANYLGRHLPGEPTVVVKNMPGAGGLKMTNWLYNVAPRDGTALGTAPQAVAIEQALGSEGIQYDARNFAWIGRAAPVVEVTYTWHTSPIKTLADAQRRETIMGGSGPTSPTVTYLRALNVLAGTQFKIIAGFPGTTEINLAMERGEVEGTTKSWASMKVDNADWLRDRKVNILLQYALESSPDLPGVPLMMDLGRTEAEGRALRFIAAGNAMGRSIVAPPDLPPARLAILRQAFMATMRDPALVAEAEKRKVDLEPMDGEALHKLVAETLDVSPEVIVLVKTARDG